MANRPRGYTREFKEDTVEFKPTLHFSKLRMQKLEKYCKRDKWHVRSRASQIEEIVNRVVDKVKLGGK
jgi:hypothetical protein